MKKLLQPKVALILLWSCFASFWIGLTLFSYSVSGNWFGLYGEIPGFEVLENPDTEIATTLYSSDGRVLGYYADVKRSQVRFEEISPSVIQTLVSTEDERFEEHSGVDMRSTIRVMKGIITLRSAGGGSTISQQLAKNLFRMRNDSIYKGPLYGTPARMLVVKAKEWITAKRLERAYTKKEIITMYLNTVNIGNYAVGIESGAKTYFNKKASELNFLESATLIGTLSANSAFDPKRRPERSKWRRNVVLGQIKKYCEKYGKDWISQSSYDSLIKEPLTIDFRSNSDYAGNATHFRATVRSEVNDIVTALGYDLKRDGLKIYTTIDLQLQKEAERAVEKHMVYLQQKFLKEWGNKNPWKKGYLDKQLRYEWFYRQLKEKHNGNISKINEELHKKESIQVLSLDSETGRFVERSVEMSPYEKFAYYKKFLQVGFVAANPNNGEIKAWVGGLHPKYFAYDHVMQGERQPGSTFKPILYSAAISNGYSPCETILDVPVVARTEDGKIWSPNIKATNKEITFKTCLAKSLNNCAALLIRNVGPRNVVKHAGQLGIPEDKLEANLSLALGTSELSMLDLIKPYMAFANQGELVMPHYITKIEDQYGRIIWERKVERKKVLKPMDAFKMVTMLREGILHNRGTGRALRTKYNLLERSNQLGGKTGTTNGSKDGWFVGIHNDLVCVTWVGVDDNNIQFRYDNRWYGGSMALPIYGEFMSRVLTRKIGGMKYKPFDIPSDIDDRAIIEDLRCAAESLDEDDGIEFKNGDLNDL